MGDTTRTRRRWFSYSLQTLLVAVTLLAIWMGIQVETAHRQRQAVRDIRAYTRYAAVYYDYQPLTLGLKQANVDGFLGCAGPVG